MKGSFKPDFGGNIANQRDMIQRDRDLHKMDAPNFGMLVNHGKKKLVHDLDDKTPLL